MTNKAELGIKNVRLLQEQHEDGTIRELWMQSAWDFTVTSPKTYGLHGAELTFLIRRELITVTLRWMTPFYLPDTRKRLATGYPRESLFDGLGSIDYHSPKPSYPNQTPVRDCEYTGGDCYCDGTSLGAMELFDKAVVDPEEIWLMLKSWLETQEKKCTEEIKNERNFS